MAAAVVVEAAVAVFAGFPGALVVAAVVAVPMAVVDDDAAVVGARLKSAADGAGRPVAAAAAVESVPGKWLF